MCQASVDPRVFVSYSHKDHRLAEAIVRYLERRGCDVWIDSQRLRGQQDWARNVDEAIGAASMTVGILTRDSVRRPEVLRELALALRRSPEEGHVMPPAVTFSAGVNAGVGVGLGTATTAASTDADVRRGTIAGRLLLVVVGPIHDSWFANRTSPETQSILAYKARYQFIQLNAHGDVTIAAMERLLDAIRHGAAEVDGGVSTAAAEIVTAVTPAEANTYVCETGIPTPMHGNGENYFYYKVQPRDLARSTVYPFALDNQWVPKEVYGNDALRASFMGEGFSSEVVAKVIKQYQRCNLYLALMHARQVIVNKSALLNSGSLVELRQGDAQGDAMSAQSKAFQQLLANGTLVVFLYGDNETEPYVAKSPKYETSGNSIVSWNDLCVKVPMYCIRENWSSNIDRHSIDFVRFSTTLADDVDGNILLAKGMGISEDQHQQFLSTLKYVAVQSFIQARFTGSNVYESIRGLSRSYLYQNFIVRTKGEGRVASQPVLNCLFDENKPFCRELKTLVDTFYNSLFTNYFSCRAMLPNDTGPEDLFVSERYLDHGEAEVTADELAYALSEFLLQIADASGRTDVPTSLVNLDAWDLPSIVQLRRTSAWHDYIDLIEASIDRNQHWSFDFGMVPAIAESFTRAVREYWHMAHADGEASMVALPYSFRICVGSGAIDLVVGHSVRLVRMHEGAYDRDQNPLLVFFQLGDILKRGAGDSIFSRVLLFDGQTDQGRGEAYVDQMLSFLKENSFVEVAGR